MIKPEKLILGTVQFGLSYGINNTAGQISETEAQDILEYAALKGVHFVDTAAAYGNAEEVIGRFNIGTQSFRIITKFDKSNNLTWEESIKQSINKLNIKKVHIAMFHSFADYLKSKPFLSQIISDGKGVYFDQIGVSVYTNEEMLQLADDDRIEVVQLPFNMLDNDYLRGETIKFLKNKGKVIHTRSVFLQGLFFKEVQHLDNKFAGIKDQLKKIWNLALDNDITVNALALQYVLSKDYIDGVLIGVDSKKQLEQNIDSLHYELDSAVFKEIDRLKTDKIDLLNPSKW